MEIRPAGCERLDLRATVNTSLVAEEKNLPQIRDEPCWGIFMMRMSRHHEFMRRLGSSSGTECVCLMTNRWRLMEVKAHTFSLTE